MTLSPASSALQTPPSNADIDGHDEASAVVTGGVNGGISSSGINATSFAPKLMRTGNVSSSEAEKIKALLSRDRSAFASAAR